MPTPTSLIRRVEQLEALVQRQQQTIQGLLGRQPRASTTRWTYLAKTVPLPNQPYPATGNTFGIVFIDREFTPTVGQQPATDYPRSAADQAIGRSIDGRYIKQGTVVVAIPAPPPPGTSDKGIWHILPVTPEPNDLVVFQLLQELPLGGEAEASLCELQGNAYVATGEQIVVRDPSSGYGMWAGRIGFQGVAKEASDGKYDILHMQRVALIVAFTTQGDRNPSSGVFTGRLVLPFQQGDQPPTGVGELIAIQDVDVLFPRALHGGKGLAIWNDVVGIYQCLIVQQQCILARALVNQQGGFSGTGLVGIDNFAAISPAPFNLVPANPPQHALNYFLHRGKDNDDLLLAWDEAADEWIIIDVEKRQRKVVMGLRLKPDKKWIQVEEAECAVEFAQDPQWVDKIELGTCQGESQ